MTTDKPFITVLLLLLYVVIIIGAQPPPAKRLSGFYCVYSSTLSPPSSSSSSKDVFKHIPITFQHPPVWNDATSLGGPVVSNWCTSATSEIYCVLCGVDIISILIKIVYWCILLLVFTVITPTFIFMLYGIILYHLYYLVCSPCLSLRSNVQYRLQSIGNLYHLI